MVFNMFLCFALAIIVAVECSLVQDKELASPCPSGTTQCGLFSCCPLPSAVCCSDGVHCCPNGYVCNYALGGCTRSQMFSPFLEKNEYYKWKSSCRVSFGNDPVWSWVLSTTLGCLLFWWCTLLPQRIRMQLRFRRLHQKPDVFSIFGEKEHYQWKSSCRVSFGNDAVWGWVLPTTFGCLLFRWCTLLPQRLRMQLRNRRLHQKPAASASSRENESSKHKIKSRKSKSRKRLAENITWGTLQMTRNLRERYIDYFYF